MLHMLVGLLMCSDMCLPLALTNDKFHMMWHCVLDISDTWEYTLNHRFAHVWQYRSSKLH